MNKNVVVLGGGNGMSTLLKGLKNFPLNITSVANVSDNGGSSGKLSEMFNIPAVGDVRRDLIALSETEKVVEELFNYRFDTSEFNGHTIGNLLLTATTEITGSFSKGIEALSNILLLKGKVLPLTEEYVTLMANTTNGVVEGEYNITNCPYVIENVFYKNEPIVNKKVLKEIKKADFIIISMGSIFTSVLPHLICKEVVEAIEKSNAKILYCCNMMSQPGETDGFNVSDHVNVINKYLGNSKIDVVFVNNAKISEEVKLNNLFETFKEEVVVDKEILEKNIKVKQNNYIKIENGILKHDSDILCLDIYSYILSQK